MSTVCLPKPLNEALRNTTILSIKGALIFVSCRLANLKVENWVQVVFVGISSKEGAKVWQGSGKCHEKKSKSLPAVC